MPILQLEKTLKFKISTYIIETGVNIINYFTAAKGCQTQNFMQCSCAALNINFGLIEWWTAFILIQRISLRQITRNLSSDEKWFLEKYYEHASKGVHEKRCDKPGSFPKMVLLSSFHRAAVEIIYFNNNHPRHHNYYIVSICPCIIAFILFYLWLYNSSVHIDYFEWQNISMGSMKLWSMAQLLQKLHMQNLLTTGCSTSLQPRPWFLLVIYHGSTQNKSLLFGSRSRLPLCYNICVLFILMCFAVYKCFID